MFHFKALFPSKSSPKADSELINILSAKSRWSSIYINKGKDKQKKKIIVPDEHSKDSLRIVLRDFQKRAKCHKAVYSYQSGISFTDLANQHREKRFLLKADIKNFFDNISQKNVSECLLGYYDASLAKKISDFVCHEGKLPFGSPFSPYFSNIYLKNLDEYMLKTCSPLDAVYSRYADDIYVSCNKKEVLEGLIGSISDILKDKYPNLELNDFKTAILTTPFHVGSFTVHQRFGVNLCKSYKRLIRVKLHKYSISELDDTELPSLKGLLLFLKGNDSTYFEKLSKKFPLEIDEIISMSS